MKNILKAWLRKNQLTRDPNDYVAQIAVAGNLGMSDVIDELLRDGKVFDRELAIDIIADFNRKSAQLVANGNNVNTGLINMRSSIRGSLYAKKWNSTVNKIEVILSPSFDLSQAIAETTVEFIGEKNESQESNNHSKQSVESTEDSQFKIRNAEMHVPQLKIVGEPACGIAFRTWLCKA